MKSITIGFSKPNHFKLGAWIIMTTEGTNFSHTYLKIDQDIWQESLPKFNKTSISEFLGINTVVYEYDIQVTEEQYSKIITFCEKCLQEQIPYGKREIVGTAIVRSVNQLFKTKFKNPFSDDLKTMICSEFVGNILEILGLDFPNDELEVDGPKFIRQKVVLLVDKQH
jgi:hypothetical protein